MMNHMKVCLVNNLYPPYARGGAEQVVVKTVQGLLVLGHTVVVITTTPYGPEKEVVGDLTIYRYHPKNIFFYTEAHHHHFLARVLWHVIDLFHISSARAVARIIAEEKPDVIHTHNLMGMSFLIPRFIRRLNTRYVHTVHDVQLVEPSGIIRKNQEHSWRYTGFPVRIYSAMVRWLFDSPDVVISPSQFLLKFYESRGFFPRSKRVFLRNPTTSSGQLRTRKSHAGLALLYLGQIEEHKGILFLVKTFLNLITTASVPIALHIAGSGSQLDQVKTLVAGVPQVVVHGKVSRDALPELFAGIDLTVVPSLCYENSPTVIFESFSFGVPVLASNVEGIAELIAEGENGFTFATEDALALTDRLRFCMLHPEALQMMSEKIAQSPLRQTEEEYIGRLLELYGG